MSAERVTGEIQKSNTPRVYRMLINLETMWLDLKKKGEEQTAGESEENKNKSREKRRVLEEQRVLAAMGMSIYTREMGLEEVASIWAGITETLLPEDDFQRKQMVNRTQRKLREMYQQIDSKVVVSTNRLQQTGRTRGTTKVW